MESIFHPAEERGSADFGWLQAKHSFSFGQWYEPKKMHFGLLRVLNDDWVQGGGGFPTHPHNNMEIITIPLQGALQHRDSTGGSGIINKNDVQIMSAGTGVQHSEFNASATEPVNLLQLWIFPKEKDIIPRYDQKTFLEADRINRWQCIVSNLKNDDTLWINQDATLALSILKEGKTLSYTGKIINAGFYIFVIEGSITIGKQILRKRDAIACSQTDRIEIMAETDSEILLIEVPVNTG
jgi:redox-sensitive bicupin YhaK (pirin superfamily)